MSRAGDRPPQRRAMRAILDGLEGLPREGHVRLGEIVERLGVRGFAPVLLLVALLMVSPLSGIPGSPTVTALLIALIVGQMLVGRRALWLPQPLMRLRVPARRLRQALAFLRGPVQRVDPLLRPRLLMLTSRPGALAILLTCLALTLVMPVMELLPFAISFAALAVALLSVGLMTRDGAMVLAGYGLLAVVLWGVAAVLP